MQAERLVAGQVVCEDILNEVVLLLCKENVQSAILEAHQHLEYLRLLTQFVYLDESHYIYAVYYREQNAIMELAIDAVGSELLTSVVATECQHQCYEACVYEAALSGVAGDVFEEMLQDEARQAARGVFQQERKRKKLELEAIEKEHLRRVLNKYWKM